MAINVIDKIKHANGTDPVVEAADVLMPDGNRLSQWQGSGQALMRRKYVEEFKTDSNTWNEAFDALFAYCEANSYVACAADTIYYLDAPLYIGNIDVDFENCELYNNVQQSDSNPACVVLVGSECKVHRFGIVTGRQSIGILINTRDAKYEYNKLSAKMARGYYHALSVRTTNFICNFNEIHILRLRSSKCPIRVCCDSYMTKWVNELYFFVGILESYREITPENHIWLTNTNRCNFYNLDIEPPVTDCAVVLENCQFVAFYNPRTQEPANPVQFRFLGESYGNYVESEYCKYSVIDSSQMMQTDTNYNVFRGSVMTKNSGDTTNCRGLRVYKDLCVPELLLPLTRVADQPEMVIAPELILDSFADPVTNTAVFGIPTLFKWQSGDLIVNKRFIALLPATIQVMRVSEEAGKILDTEGNLIVEGADLELNKRYDLRLDSLTYRQTDPIGGWVKTYVYYDEIVIAVGELVGPLPEPAPQYPSIDSLTVQEYPLERNGFVRQVGTINETSTNYCRTEYIPLADAVYAEYNSYVISTSDIATWAIFDADQNWLASSEDEDGSAYYNIGTDGAAMPNGYMHGILTLPELLQRYPTAAYMVVSTCCHDNYETQIDVNGRNVGWSCATPYLKLYR